jgi:3-dehydroquinate dehydratase-2
VRAPVKALILRGPNLNLFGRRGPHTCRTTTLAQSNERLGALARTLDVEIETLQSKHEGVLVDKLHDCIDSVQG